ncbi:unnamed protein product [Rotaria sp. Silwood1]|nr:unnamed protein product [Rotaria sp. Silwood1]CAF4568884.1 unnamed protein product [Rotaria sp. Silwood1]
MGANGSSEIQLTFNRPNLFYFAGEQISGNISFQNTQDKLMLDAVFLECVGELGYTTREHRHYHDKDGQKRTEYYTKYHQIPFLNFRIAVAQPQYGQREITLYRGQHSWPFEFILPSNLPPSLIPSTISYPYVKYYTRIVLDKPWYKPNAKQIFPLTIFPHVNLLHIPGGQQHVVFSNENRKKIRIEGFLIRGGVVPGEKLSIHINLQNPNRSEIKRIEATLIQHRQVAQSCHAEVIFRLDLPDVRGFNDTELRRTFDLIVPAVHLSPTYTYMATSFTVTLGVSIHYELILDVKARGLFTDFKISVPVVVGTEPIAVEHQQQQMNHPIEMPTASAPAFEYDEPPPSYDVVVANQKMDSKIQPTSSSLDLDQHGKEAAYLIPNSSTANANSHVITDNVNKITITLSSTENNHCILTNLAASNERCYIACSSCSNNADSEIIDISVQTSNYNYCDSENENKSGHSEAVSKDVILCEKLISNLLSLKKVNENINTL